tara:strand:- start:3579 stop:5162 length:1584 start_codon:yes stop_codon:yes gene_type:complete
MTLTTFARMCETLEEQSPSVKQFTVNQGLSAFKKNEKKLVVQILALELPQNNIAQVKATKWLASAFDVVASDISSTKRKWGDLGQAMYYSSFVDTDCGMTINEFHRLLNLDCSNMQGDSYRIISEALRTMSGLELKWFVRYWLRTPRNGLGKGSNGVLKKALQNHYFEDRIANWSKFNELHKIVEALEDKREPPEGLTIGSPIKPMLAKKYNGSIPFHNMHFDIKYDGNRYLIHCIGEGDYIIFNRARKIIENARFQDVLDIMDTWWGGFVDEDGSMGKLLSKTILDCEIYPVDEEGNPVEHQRMGKRVHSNNIEEAIRECPVRLVVFDMLMCNGNTIIDQPYRQRLDDLPECVPESYIATSLDSLDAGYNIAIAKGFEGIMIKNLDAPYDMGKRSSNLLKHKPPRFEFDVVVTSAEYGDGKRAHVFGTYGISCSDGNGGYVPVGSVGTGFSEKQLMSLTVTLKKIVAAYTNPVYHFLPRVVLQVTCDAVTTNQDGSVGLRFPRLMRIRDDKAASEVDTIEMIQSSI